MREDIKDMWVAKLRSGIPQGKGALNRNGNMCCLGVLCEVAIEEGLEVESGTDGGMKLYDGQPSVLPQSVKNWAGLSAENPNTGTYYKTDAGTSDWSLAELNDNGFTFEEMAEVIETHWERL